jgi:hypothetical protein
MQFDAPPGLRLDPPIENAPAWKCDHMHAVTADDGEFEFAIEGRRGDRQPSAQGGLGLQHAASLARLKVGALISVKWGNLPHRS